MLCGKKLPHSMILKGFYSTDYRSEDFWFTVVILVAEQQQVEAVTAHGGEGLRACKVPCNVTVNSFVTDLKKKQKKPHNQNKPQTTKIQHHHEKKTTKIPHQNQTTIKNPLQNMQPPSASIIIKYNALDVVPSVHILHLKNIQNEKSCC